MRVTKAINWCTQHPQNTTCHKVSAAYASAIIIACFLISTCLSFREERVVGSVAVCGNVRLHLLFSQKGFCLYPLQNGSKKGPLEKSFALTSLCCPFGMLSGQEGQWLTADPIRRLLSIHLITSLQGCLLWGVAVGFSQNEISGQPNGCLWTRCRRNQVPDVKPTAPPPIVTTHFSGQKKSTI